MVDEVQAPINLHALSSSQELALVLVPSHPGCSDHMPSLLLHQHSVSFHVGPWRPSSKESQELKMNRLFLCRPEQKLALQHGVRFIAA